MSKNYFTKNGTIIKKPENVEISINHNYDELMAAEGAASKSAGKAGVLDENLMVLLKDLRSLLRFSQLVKLLRN